MREKLNIVESTRDKYICPPTISTTTKQGTVLFPGMRVASFLPPADVATAARSEGDFTSLLGGQNMPGDSFFSTP